MPRTSELASFYPEGYHSLRASGLLQNLRHDLRLRRLTNYTKGVGTLLDFGCGNGSFTLRAARQWPSAKLFGFEIADRCEVKNLIDGRVTLVRGSLEDLLTVLTPCNVITMNHVIEHLPAPTEVLGMLRGKLVTNGVLEGQTPCADSLEHRVFRARWSGYHAPRHTIVFSKLGLRSLMELNRFGDIKITAAFNPASIAVSLASTLHGERPGIIHRSGIGWMGLLGLSTLLSPFDVFSKSPGIIDFSCRKE